MSSSTKPSIIGQNSDFEPGKMRNTSMTAKPRPRCGGRRHHETPTAHADGIEVRKQPQPPAYASGWDAAHSDFWGPIDKPPSASASLESCSHFESQFFGLFRVTELARLEHSCNRGRCELPCEGGFSFQDAERLCRQKALVVSACTALHKN